MESFKKFFLILWVANIATAAFVSSRMSRSRIPRNAVNNQDDNTANPQFLFLRRVPPSHIVADVNENRVLECEAGGSPPPTIHWLRNGQPTDQSIENEIQTSNGISEAYIPVLGIGSTKSRLFLDCTGPQDEGEYTCVAETPFQTKSATTHLSVKESERAQMKPMCVSTKKSSVNANSPARINMWSGNILETMGNDVVLFCRTLGSPPIHNTWLVDDEVISNNAKYRVQKNGDLLIHEIEWRDMGEYTCVAENSVGRDSAVTFLYPVKKG